MHQPDTNPRRSLYCQYQVVAAAPKPADAAANVALAAPVVIVGGGPIGLSLALFLARHGQACVLLHAEQQVCEGSRAIAFTRRTMDILRQIGADVAVTAQGLPWSCGNSFYRQQRVFRMSAPSAGLRPACPPRGASKVAKQHLLESNPSPCRRPLFAEKHAKAPSTRLWHCF